MNKPTFEPHVFPHWTEIPARFRDLDPLNHVNNSLFCTYYEEARIQFIGDIDGLRTAMQKGFSFVLANINIDFLQPVEYPATLLVGSGIRRVGHTSVSSFQAIYDADTKDCYSLAESTGVWINLEDETPAKVPEIKNLDELKVRSKKQ